MKNSITVESINHQVLDDVKPNLMPDAFLKAFYDIFASANFFGAPLSFMPVPESRGDAQSLTFQALYGTGYVCDSRL